jgi:predicted AAA+ superfamily ATPase
VREDDSGCYLDILTDCYVMRQLRPWLPNMKKRLVKAPKVYLRDSGLFHSLLGINTLPALQSNPRFGASWEGFAGIPEFRLPDEYS